MTTQPFPLHVQTIIVKAKCGQDATYATLNHAQKKAVDIDVQSTVEAAVGCVREPYDLDKSWSYEEIHMNEIILETRAKLRGEEQV